MPTTPRGIWTPADTDDWDLTVDWAANAASIDSAITNAVAEAQPADTGWVNFSPESGITASVLTARKIGNLVTVYGISVVLGTPSAAPLLAVAPVQFRPANTRVGAARTSSGTAAIQINSSGQISAFPENQETITNVVAFTITYLA